MRFILVALALLFGAVSPAAAQSVETPAASEASPEALAAARRLIVAARIEQAMFDSAYAMVEAMLLPQLRQRGVSAEEQQRILNIFHEEIRIDPEPLVEAMTHVYARRLSAEDMDAAADFYATPVGQRLLDAQPDLLRDSIPIGMVWGRDMLGPRIARRLEQLRNEGVIGPT